MSSILLSVAIRFFMHSIGPRPFALHFLLSEDVSGSRCFCTPKQKKPKKHAGNYGLRFTRHMPFPL